MYMVVNGLIFPSLHSLSWLLNGFAYSQSYLIATIDKIVNQMAKKYIGQTLSQTLSQIYY